MAATESIQISHYWTHLLSSEMKAKWAQELHNLSQSNLNKITKDYLEKRLNKYESLLVAHDNKEIIGYMFSHIYETSFVFFKVPTVHIGLTVVDKKYRRQNIAGRFAYNVYLATKEKLGGSFFLSGVILTSKCSSPISFLRMQRASLNFGLPRIKNEKDFTFLSRSSPSQKLSQILTNTIAGETSSDYLLRNVNIDSGFQLENEEFIGRNTKEQNTIDFFKRNVMPHNELLFVSWVHPVFLLWW